MYKLFSLMTLGAIIATASAQSKDIPAQNVLRSADGTFEFRYPRSLVLCYPKDKHSASEPDSCLSYIPMCSTGSETTLACVAYPQAPYKNTNFEGAAFFVGEDSDAKTEKECQHFDELTTYEKTAHWETIGGVRFRVASGAEAGLGHGMGENVYRAFHNGKCYDLEVRITAASFANFDPGTIREFKDSEKITAKLRAVLGSFRFLN